MNFKKGYPRFGFPSSVNRELFAVAISSAQDEASIIVPKDASMILINIDAAAPKVNVQLDDYQKFPLNLALNNNAEASVVTLSINLEGNQVATLEVNAEASKLTNFIVGPSMIADSLFAQIISTSEAVESVVEVAEIEKNVGMTYEGATAKVEKNVITFSGKIPYYAADPALGRVEGNRVGVQIKAPAGAELEASKFIIDDVEYDSTALDKVGEDYVLNWWPLMSIPGQQKTITLDWVVAGTLYQQIFVVAIAADATFAPASEALPK